MLRRNLKIKFFDSANIFNNFFKAGKRQNNTTGKFIKNMQF